MRDYLGASGSLDRGHLEADNALGPIDRADILVEMRRQMEAMQRQIADLAAKK